MKRLLLLFLVVIISSSATYAAEVEVNVKNTDNSIPAGGIAIYEVEIINNQLANDVFKIKADELSLHPFSDFAADLMTEPAELEIIRNGKGSIKVYLRTLSDADDDKTYELPIKVYSKIDKDIEVKSSLLVRVLPATKLIEVVPEIPKKIAPGKETPFVLTFKNNGNIILDDAEVYISSPILTDTRILTFKPDLEIEEKFVFDIGSDVQPGNYPFTVRVYKDDEIKGVFTTEIEVVLNTDVEEMSNTFESFLRKRIVIINENTGNFVAEREVKYATSGLPKFFTRINPDASYENGIYVWEFNLDPKEVYEIEILIDYRTPVIIILLIIAALGVLYYFLTKDVRIKKKVFKVRHNLEDNITELKIMLHVKNKIGKPIKDVKVTDLLPSNVILSKEFGTLKPDHIQKGTSGGMRLIWDIGDFAVGEERVLNYNIKTKADYTGDINLAASNVRYVNERGEIKTVIGNNVSFRR